MKILLSAILSLILVLSLTNNVLAQNQNAPGLLKRAEKSSVASQASQKKEEARLKSCQARQDAINKRSDKLVTLAENITDKFDAISLRVMEFYTSKLEPQGKTVSNYEELTANVAVKKLAVQEALTEAEANLVEFNCESENPADKVRLFNEDMRSVKDALKEYRTSVRELIVGVKSVTGQENRNRPMITTSLSPTP